jgi:hypothetical protein
MQKDSSEGGGYQQQRKMPRNRLGDSQPQPSQAKTGGGSKEDRV